MTGATGEPVGDLRGALAEIAREAIAKDSILQAGAAFALGVLAEAADCQPGWSTDDVADALLGSRS